MMYMIISMILLSTTCLIMYMYRSISSVNKLLITNSIVTQLLLVIALISVYMERYYYIDILIIYGCVGFVCVTCLLKILYNKKV